MKYIDLTQPLTTKTPVYPGDPKTKISPSAVFDKDGYNDHFVCVGTHVGTHIDAPLHMLDGGKTLDQFPIEHFIGRGVLIVDHNIKAADIQMNDIVLFHTGFSKNYNDQKYFEEYPVLTEDVANYLVSKKVKMIGVDTCSPDKSPFNIHKILLKNDILIIENLTNLDQLVSKKFMVFALPIKLQLDAAQARVVAQINE